MSSLFCWFNWEDNTTTVNSINIIKEPRKPLNEYKKGDKVLAKLPQFGLWNGEIVEISESKKDLIIEMNKRQKLATSGLEPGDNQVKEKDTEAVLPVKAAAESNKGKKRKIEGKGSEKIDQKAIELAANELELTELEESLSTKNPDEVENASQTSESLSENINTSKEAESVAFPVSIRESLDIVHGSGSPVKVPRFQEPATQPVHVPAVNGYLEQQVHMIRQELYQANNRIAHLESSYTWLWNAFQQIQNNGTQPFQNVNTPEYGESSMCSSSDSQKPGQSSEQSTSGEELIGGFTVSQLESKVAGVTSYSKMAIQLFRLLFKEEEYAGKSLTGAPAKSGERKPAVDQERLQGIYGIISKHFPHVTPVMVREKLRDVLKPSRLNRNFKK